MERTYFRHLLYIYGKKIIFLLFPLFLVSGSVFGQAGGIFGHGRDIHQRFYDYNRTIHFGFVLGSNFSNFKYERSSYWYEHGKDSIQTVHVERLPGLTLGAVADLHLGEHFDLRFVPSLVLTQRNILYGFYDGVNQKKSVESAFGEFPLMLKFKSERYDNLRFYIIGGGKYSYDFSSDYKAKKNPIDPKVAVIPHVFSYEFGTGLDFYFQYFKFSPEIKLSKGINNVLSPDDAIISKIFSRFRSNTIFISLYFEG